MAQDDAISQLLHQTQGSLPAAKPKSLPVARPTPAPVQPPVVMSAHLGEHDDRTRLVIELSDPVNLRAFNLANPNRIILDMPEVAWRMGAPPVPSGHGLIKAYRYGLFRSGNSRMVIDLSRPARLGETLAIPPAAGFGYRVVIDLFPTSQASFEADAGWPADLRAREAEAERKAMIATTPALAGKKVVVIDPGHGGVDSGTKGVNGLLEKDLVLEEGLRLAKELRARGFTVFMTRDKDSFIPLRDRVAFGRAHHADLFISLHADSNPDSSVTGLSIYTLNDGRSDREAAELAKRENQSDVIAGVDLSGGNSPVAPILIDLAQRDTINKSSRFAEAALARLAGTTDILPRSPHRSASLAVLVAPDVPAVLIELGYLSNRADAEQMNTEVWRTRVAGAIAAAVGGHLGAAGTSAKNP
ncbi:MAG: N-acetylmuramoyl-L-alanine amidase [Alphaproteobacteria bacterium]|nr:N-acetylmuramoyl-L-alanine amidase [Alphaproteobacteria bacterium]